MAFDRAPLAPGEQTEPLVEPLRELRRAQHRDPGRGQAPTPTGSHRGAGPLRRPRRVGVGHREVRLHRHRPFDQQPRRVAAQHRVPVTGTWQPERWHGHDAFTGNAQTLSARREHHQPRTPLLERAYQLDHRAQQVLAVVEHQQQLFRSQSNRPACPPGPHPVVGSPRTPPRPPSTTTLGSRTRASSTSHAPPRNSGDDLGCHLARQTRLAHATHAGQRHHPRLTHQRGELGDFPFAADERAVLHRQIARKRIQRLQRGKLTCQPRCHHLEHLDRLREVAQPMFARGPTSSTESPSSSPTSSCTARVANT